MCTVQCFQIWELQSHFIIQLFVVNMWKSSLLKYYSTTRNIVEECDSVLTERKYKLCRSVMSFLRTNIKENVMSIVGQLVLQ